MCTKHSAISSRATPNAANCGAATKEQESDSTTTTTTATADATSAPRDVTAFDRSIHAALTYVDEHAHVSCAQVVQDGGFVEVGQVGHVLVHEELGRVHLLNVVLLHLTVLKIATNNKL